MLDLIFKKYSSLGFYVKYEDPLLKKYNLCRPKKKQQNPDTFYGFYQDTTLKIFIKH